MELIIRPARMEDLDRCWAIESACFPPEQAASRASISDRIRTYPRQFLLGELEGVIVGYVMGPVICRLTIDDEMFSDTGCHSEAHPYQSVFSLAVHPDYQRQGFGRLLLDALIAQSRAEGRQAVTLTCRERKVAYYESFGFRSHGVAASVHGGVTWYDMILPLSAS